MRESESHPQGELENAGIFRSSGAHEVGVVLRSIRPLEVDAIKRVERFKAQHGADLFGNGKTLEQAEVDGSIARPAEDIPAKVAKRPWNRAAWTER